MSDNTLLRVRVVVGAKETAVVGCGDDGVWKIRVAAKPVEGAANAELVRFLSGRLGVAKRDIVIEGGLTSKVKRVRVEMREAVLMGRMTPRG